MNVVKLRFRLWVAPVIVAPQQNYPQFQETETNLCRYDAFAARNKIH